MKGSSVIRALPGVVALAGLLALPWWAQSYYVHIVALIGVFVVVAVA